MKKNPPILPGIMLAAILVAGAPPALARHGTPPYGLVHADALAVATPLIEVGSIDAAQKRRDDDRKSGDPLRARDKRLHVAAGIAVALSLEHDAAVERLGDGSTLYRLAVRAAGATDLRIAFAPLALPDGATLHVIAADGTYQGPYTSRDAVDARFDSPPVPGDTATIELRIPSGAGGDWSVALTSVGAGFRDLARRGYTTFDTGPGTSGACNVDVVCPLGDGYPDEIRATAYFEYEAADDHEFYLCSGTLLNDVPADHRNLFLTAAHCVSTPSEAASMVIDWNYQSTACGTLSAPAGGFFADEQHGAILRATRADADFGLVELATAPDADWNVYYAGWDASGDIPSGTIGIHHPSGDVKKITRGPAPSTTDNCIGTGGSSTDTHWWTGPYSQGTTEGGSSGSGLFALAGSQHARRLIGTLSGGYAACSIGNPAAPDDENDCYGKLSAAWNGASASSRLRDWLDPAGTGTLTIAGSDANAVAAPPTRGHSTHRRPASRTPFVR